MATSEVEAKNALFEVIDLLKPLTNDERRWVLENLKRAYCFNCGRELDNPDARCACEY